MAFRKTPILHNLSSGSSTLAYQQKKTSENGRILTAGIYVDSSELPNQDLNPELFSLQNQLNAGVDLREVNSVVLNGSPTQSQLDNVESLVTPKTED